MKIFLGLTEIAGYFSNLKKGFESLGIKTTFIDFSENPFKYSGNDNDIFLVKLILSAKKNKENALNKIIISFFTMIDRFLRVFLFTYLVFTHDIFIFGFATTFFSYKELKILKLLNKKIVYVFLGSDSRPPYLDGAVMSKGANLTIDDCINLTKIRKKNVLNINKFSDVIIDNVPQALFHEKKFVSWLSIGIPYTSNFEYKISKNIIEDTDIIKILHSPSNPEVKGTDLIRIIIENLKNKGYKIDFIEITGKPNSYVVEKINQCDFVIDQIYSDTPMAGFATEAAFFGKPSIIAGYFSDVIENYVENKFIPPSVYCNIDELEFNIENLIINKDIRIDLGKKAQEFVKEKWNPKIVAQKYLEIINGNINIDDLIDPNKIEYIYGGGMSKNKLKIIVKSIIEKNGIKALQLSDKPKIEQIFLDFIKE